MTRSKQITQQANKQPLWTSLLDRFLTKPIKPWPNLQKKDKQIKENRESECGTKLENRESENERGTER